MRIRTWSPSLKVRTQVSTAVSVYVGSSPTLPTICLRVRVDLRCHPAKVVCERLHRWFESIRKRYEVMLGNPKFKKNDNVSFEFDGVIKQGYVYIVDAYGTFFQADEPSYNVMVENEKYLYKHIPESWVREYMKARDGNGF